MVRLNTLGRPHVSSDDGEEVALQPLALAVLAYLAVRGPADRTHLAQLFWPNSKNGLNSLSTTLNRIRAQVPDSVWVQGNTLVGTDIASDVSDIHDAVDRTDVASLARLYTAAFLGNLSLRRKSTEFEEWMLDTRTNLASTVELTLLQQSSELFDRGDHRAAAQSAERAWEIAVRDGFPSPDSFEAYHRILASAASPSANSVRALAEEFGIELSLVEPISTDRTRQPGDATQLAQTSFDDHDIGSPTPLFGCEAELRAIAASVTTNTVTTLAGLGGSGKTRLAAEFFGSSEAERNFGDRHWIDLRDVTDHELVGPAIAAALGHRFDDVAALADRLPHDDLTLLVLDNFEQVADAAPITEELVQANAAIRVLVTSRVPLAVGGESLVQLSGLDTDDRESSSPAEQLFASSARRAGAGDDRLGESSRTSIRDICRRVGGNPLALQIAGGWAQVLSPAEILDALSPGNELLESSMVSDLRTMDTVLNQSWSTLTEADQQALMLLAAFPGGCPTKHALSLRELPINGLGRLVQHSLIRMTADGRITLHPLIASHALSELQQRPELTQSVQGVLRNWCQTFASTTQTDADGTFVEAFSVEITNITSAWSWDAEHGLWELHSTTLEPVRQFFTESARISEGRALFKVIADSLRADPDHPTGLLAAVLEALGWFQLLSGQVARAQARLDEALAASTDDLPHQKAQMLRTLGAIQLTTGAIDDATASFTAGLALVANDTSALAASLQYDLAQAHHYRGERDQATSAARLALQAGRSANNWMVIARSYLLLADIEVDTDPQRAIVLLNEGWAIANEASLDHLAIYFPSVLGLAHLKLNQAERAESYFADGMHAANQVGQLATVCANHVGRAEARLLRSDTNGAIDDLKTGIRLALKTGSGRYLMWAAVVCCSAAVHRSELADHAQELLALTLRHPATDQEARDKATKIWSDHFDGTPLPLVDAITNDGAPDLDEIAERSLELLLRLRT